MNKPNLMVKAYNLLKASYRRSVSGFENVDEVTFYDRVHTCTRCDKFDYEIIQETPLRNKYGSGLDMLTVVRKK